ncbi:MAG: sigma-70 family RNA polymerase sigma factor [Salibacteraceae bacterium]
MSKSDFNQQVISLKQPLEYFALHLTMNEEDAKDLLQDTIVKALVYKEKFQERTNLKAWLYTIMKNTFINNYRRKTKANTIIDQTEDLYYLNTSSRSDGEHPETTYAVREIRKKIGQLEEEYRRPFEMHNKGFKYKEIAEELSLPIGTVKSRIFLARRKLMSALTDYQP